MKRFILGAFALAFGSIFAPEVAYAAPTQPDEDTEVYVVNSHRVAVRAFAEDASGRLHSLGKIERGEVINLDIPEAIATRQYRLKFVPAPYDVWSPVSDDRALKTAPLSGDHVRKVTVWIQPDLALSDVEVEVIDEVAAN